MVDPPYGLPVPSIFCAHSSVLLTNTKVSYRDRGRNGSSLYSLAQSADSGISCQLLCIKTTLALRKDQILLLEYILIYSFSC